MYLHLFIPKESIVGLVGVFLPLGAVAEIERLPGVGPAEVESARVEQFAHLCDSFLVHSLSTQSHKRGGCHFEYF